VIATSSWFTQLDPVRYARIGISRGVPRGQSGYRRYPKLNPGPWFNSVANDDYRRRYYDEILNPLDPGRVVAELHAMANNLTPVLLCWEPPTAGLPWCHRALVSEWLFDTLGLKIFEVGKEAFGCGHTHPKLAPEFCVQREFDLGDRSGETQR
jgi:hypothetical protein